MSSSLVVINNDEDPPSVSNLLEADPAVAREIEVAIAILEKQELALQHAELDLNYLRRKYEDQLAKTQAMREEVEKARSVLKAKSFSKVKHEPKLEDAEVSLVVERDVEADSLPTPGIASGFGGSSTSLATPAYSNTPAANSQSIPNIPNNGVLDTIVCSPKSPASCSSEKSRTQTHIDAAVRSEYLSMRGGNGEYEWYPSTDETDSEPEYPIPTDGYHGGPLKDFSEGGSLNLHGIRDKLNSMNFNQPSRGFSREVISAVLGGGNQGTWPKISPEKQARFGYSRLCCAMPSLNYWLPQSPGDVGFVNVARRKWRYLGTVYPMFTRNSSSFWLYMGNYKLVGFHKMRVDEWTAMSIERQKAWCLHVLGRKWGRKIMYKEGMITKVIYELPGGDEHSWSKKIDLKDLLEAFSRPDHEDGPKLRLYQRIFEPVAYDKKMADALEEAKEREAEKKLVRTIRQPVSRIQRTGQKGEQTISRTNQQTPMSELSDSTNRDTAYSSADEEDEPLPSRRRRRTGPQKRQRDYLSNDDCDEEVSKPTGRSLRKATKHIDYTPPSLNCEYDEVHVDFVRRSSPRKAKRNSYASHPTPDSEDVDNAEMKQKKEDDGDYWRRRNERRYGY